ncbi:MAG TPA: hypothetical protein P5077_13450 [bacterium]|nr:hypothetical protein [bacterium]
MKWLVIIFAFLFIAACDGTSVIDSEGTAAPDFDTVSPWDDADGSSDDSDRTAPDDWDTICRMDDERCGSDDRSIEICTAQGWQLKQDCGELQDCYQHIENEAYRAVCQDMSEPDDKDECRINDTMCVKNDFSEESYVNICAAGTDWATLEYCGGDIYNGCREEFADGVYYAECVFKSCEGQEGLLGCANNSLYLCEDGKWVFKEDCGSSKECHDYGNSAECGEIWQDDVKPNIYLYPTAPMDITVRIGFPQGGRVTVSEPLYDDGWDVHVTPDGMIDGQWRFLFYESVQPNGWQRERGYLVSTDEMEQFFRNDLAARGFVGQEIEDFIEWWMPLLAEPGYLIVYPQDNAVIRTLETLDLSVTPDSLLRHRYVIETTAEPVTIEPPDAPVPFTRDGFTVTEWGVIRL